ncbi:hypothetical protein [Enterococcus mundtii]|uniref:hypothetical protein n=1 Tax=Enterococcus mundtii TaxID=53346 RepID=UPI0035C1CE17
MKNSKTWYYKLLLLFLFLVFAYTANRTILIYENFRQQTEDIAQVLVRTIDQLGLEVSRFEFDFSYSIASIIGTFTIVGGLLLVSCITQACRNIQSLNTEVPDGATKKT